MTNKITAKEKKILINQNVIWQTIFSAYSKKYPYLTRVLAEKFLKDFNLRIK